MTSRNGAATRAASLVLGAWLLGGCGGDGEINRAHKAALEGLKVCASLITTQEMSDFGFHSTNELSLMQLAEPFPVYDLSASMLRRWHPTQDLSQVFAKAETMLFPVTVTQDVRVSIAVAKGKWQWQTTEFGGRTLARLYARERQRSARTTGLPVSAYFCTRAPELQVYFVGYRATNGFMLISVLNEPEWRLEASVPVPASTVLPQLALAARRLGPVIR